MSSLQGVGVLVTRPEQQSAPLCRMLQTLGASTWRLPTIDIRPLGTGIDASQGFDLIIFTSVNAVRFGAPLLGDRRDLKIGAIGPATVRALNQAGFAAQVQPGESFDSEALLAHPQLAHLEDRKVLLVKGRGGRRLLEDELVRRGAHVTSAEVYERVASEPGSAALAAVQAAVAAGALHVVTATSVEIGSRLLEMAPAALRSSFDTLHWLAPTVRVADELRARGLKAPFLIARSAEDQDLVSALLSWRGAVSGA